jgi:two-component system response regulator MprA
MADPASILVVEDDVDLMQLVTDVLADEGFDVRTAPDGLAALDSIADRGLPDLILLDMRMPRMDGIEFVRELEARHADAPPVIVMTAAVDTRRRAEQVHARAWLAKPFDIQHMIALVRRILAGSDEPPPA